MRVGCCRARHVKADPLREADSTASGLELAQASEIHTALCKEEAQHLWALVTNEADTQCRGKVDQQMLKLAAALGHQNWVQLARTQTICMVHESWRRHVR